MHAFACVCDREREHYLWCAALCPGRRLKWQAHTATCSDTTNWELHLAVAVVWLCAWVCGCSCQHICRWWKRYARKGAGQYGKNSYREIFFPHIRINIHHNISQITTHRLLFASKWRYWFNLDLNIFLAKREHYECTWEHSCCETIVHHNVTQTMETRGENENSNGLQNNAQILTRSPC